MSQPPVSVGLHNCGIYPDMSVHVCSCPPLQVDSQVPVPEVGEEQVMVRIIFAGINPVETYIREGRHIAV